MNKIVLILSTILLISFLGLSGCSIAPSQAIQPLATLIPTVAPSPIPTTTAQPSPTPFIPEVPTATSSIIPVFDRQRAYEDVEHQVNFGPRVPGSEAHSQTVDWIKKELETSGWEVELQETTFENQPVRNVIAKRGAGNNPWIILGAHFDSRFFADRDPNPENRDDPVPGANDGASGVAVLLELARILPVDLDKQIWLVFFDTEDQGQIAGWDWILGSRAFAETLEKAPEAVVVVDMIGDADLNIPMEVSSTQNLVNEIWDVAAERGHGDIFLRQSGYGILDDHTPFLRKGIRAIDIIDFDYSYWHTIADTPDKVSPESLFVVGDTLLFWLLGKK